MPALSSVIRKTHPYAVLHRLWSLVNSRELFLLVDIDEGTKLSRSGDSSAESSDGSKVALSGVLDM